MNRLVSIKNSIDPIIDRSPDQKLMRVAKLRAELSDLGYSVVTTEWLAATLAGKTRAA